MILDDFVSIITPTYNCAKSVQTPNFGHYAAITSGFSFF